MNKLKQSPNAIAVIVLIALWMLFFWRILTPIDADKASFKRGDFSAQFVAFGAYQYERFAAGEIPLWNPYNNSGLPFIGDPQAAVFYPPRLITIGIATLTGGWRYRALELEAIAHVLFYTLTLYALVRRLTGSTWGGLTAAITGGYGGYLAGYPPLQLALLEAGVWLPLVVLGIHEATEHDHTRYRSLALAALALGLSWLAGHSQTSWFLTYLAVAYLVFRCWSSAQHRVRRIINGTMFMGMITFGVTAVTFIPGVEYLVHTARTGIGYAAKQNGFPLRDMIQLVYPGIVSVFSPLYIGIIGLVLVIALSYHNLKRDHRFWIGAALIGLLLSFGGNTPVFDALYNTLPGLRFFRGQERAAYLVANSLAILVGYSVALLISADHEQRAKFERLLLNLTKLTALVFGVIMILWIGNREGYENVLTPITLAFGMSGAVYLVSTRLMPTHPPQRWASVLLALMVFELFTVSMDAPSNYDNHPPGNQLALTPPPFIVPVISESRTPIRVDGFRGLGGNYGSLYGVYDARGISPLFLDGLYQLQQPPFATPNNFETNPIFWELNAVEYVYSGYDQLPVSSQIIEQGADQYGTVYLHHLSEPRPFAKFVYRYDQVDSDAFARALLADPNYRPRESVIIHQAPNISLPTSPPDVSTTEITHFSPERIEITVNTSENGLLTLAHPDYPGWQSTLDGESIKRLRAYGGFAAYAIPAGEHILTLTYAPLSFKIGAVLSLVAWLGLGIVGAIGLVVSITGSNNARNK